MLIEKVMALESVFVGSAFCLRIRYPTPFLIVSSKRMVLLAELIALFDSCSERLTSAS